MSHADHGSAEKIINWIKTLNRKGRRTVSIMLDTQGPEIRTGDISEPIDLATGEVVTLSVRDPDQVETSSIHVNYRELADTARKGSRITVDNGLLNFEVLEVEAKQLVCRVIDGGLLGSKRHVNLPGIRLNLPAITQKDRLDIEFGLAHELDFIALSFVRTAGDVDELRSILGDRKGRPGIIAKIEDSEGVANLHDITRAADGVMVARGDLGIETDIADLPNVQRRIAYACAKWGRRCIVATHLLESMIKNPIPTRAEVTDVANTVYEGADAVMLSGKRASASTRCAASSNSCRSPGRQRDSGDSATSGTWWRKPTSSNWRSTRWPLPSRSRRTVSSWSPAGGSPRISSPTRGRRSCPSTPLPTTAERAGA